ncbi:MAG: C_GCAxxG_C_C family protein [Desulfobacteraceae bacterium]|nr:MAG: C_GCAxxG_C_C family protein [Desulfobacteraceae bacterium]
MQNEDFLWAGIPFLSGISGQQQAPCGAVTAAAIGLGLRHRCAMEDKSKTKRARNLIRNSAARMVEEFAQAFGDITCKGLLGIDFSRPGEYKRFRDDGIWKDRCQRYVRFVIEKIYAFETNPPGDPDLKA